MAKKTRTELSTLAINTNLPDNTQELITPTTERAQLTDERESVVNYKDDLGGTGNAGKFLTVATDGESLTMVDEPSGVPDWVTFITAVRNQMLLKAGGDGTGTSEAWLKFTSYDGTITAQINFNGIDGSFYINGSQSQISLTSQISFIIGGTPKLTISSGGITSLLTNQEKTSTSNFEYALLGKTNEATNYGALQLLQKGATNAADRSWSFQTIEAGVANAGNIVLQPSGGNVGIGTNNPSSKLDITATRTAQLTLIELSTNTLASGVDDEISIDFGRGLLDKYSARISGYISNFSTYDGGLKFYTSSGGTLNTTPQLTISSGGLATFSNGIKFGGTPSPAYDSGADTLDAYEEGTFTPTIKMGVDTLSSGTATGIYTRVGNLVNIFINIPSIVKSGSGNDLTIEGLPYASKTGINCVIATRWGGIATSAQLSGFVSSGTSRINFQDFNTGGYNYIITQSQLSSTFHIYSLSVTYQV